MGSHGAAVCWRGKKSARKEKKKKVFGVGLGPVRRSHLLAHQGLEVRVEEPVMRKGIGRGSHADLEWMVDSGRRSRGRVQTKSKADRHREIIIPSQGMQCAVERGRGAPFLFCGERKMRACSIDVGATSSRALSVSRVTHMVIDARAHAQSRLVYMEAGRSPTPPFSLEQHLTPHKKVDSDFFSP